LRTLFNLQTLDTGFTKQNILVASIAPHLNGYKPDAARDLSARILDRVRALPGVQAAGWSNESLIAGGWDQNSIVVEGYQPKNGEPESAHFDQISPDYLSAVQIPVVAGRAFSDRDNSGAPRVAMVNEAFVRHFFAGKNSIGKHFRFEGDPISKEMEIVGVVRDARYVDLREKRAPWFAYVPVAQSDIYSLVLHVRSSVKPEKLAPVLREELRQIDPQLPLHGIRTLEAQIDESLVQERLLAILVSTFGGLATILAALGLYGVLAFSVTRRTREIGVRMALGATASQVGGLILRHTAVLVGFGMLLGIAGSFALAGVVGSMLFGVAAADPVTLALAGLSLIVVSATAAYLPARRAARVDPIEALRQE
jgi:predicted permease